MSDTASWAKIQNIPIDTIRILNPRDRDQSKFLQVVESIKKVGLKRPIKVAPIKKGKGKYEFNLVCGQGRLEAFQKLGEKHIPALIVELSEEECYIESIVENIARRHHSSLELVSTIKQLADRGYSDAEIASKTGLGSDYVRGINQLLENGEERLVAAVEQGAMPLTIAIQIAAVPNGEAQTALQTAYQSKELRGRSFSLAMKVVRNRTKFGAKFAEGARVQGKKDTAKTILDAFRKETDRQKVLIRRADLTEARLAVILSALETLLSDEHFATLLRAENLDTMPGQVVGLLGKAAE